VAMASYWVSGFIPSSNSIVFSMGISGQQQISTA
jgi:hypothetical protein